MTGHLKKAEIWRYRYIEGIGNEVLLEFVDPSMSGEYRFTIDPSEKDALLHVPGAGLTFDEEFNGRDKADRLTRDGASLGNALGNTSRNNQFDRLELSAKVFRPPEIKFKDLETIVTTKLSFNLLPFSFRTDFVRVTEESVLTPITVLLQNKDLAFQEQEGIHRAMVHVFGRVTGINDDKLSLSSLILADVVENLPTTQIGSGSFILGSTKVRPNVKDDFKRDKNLNVWFQVYNLKLDEATHKPSATVEMLITRNGQEVKKTVEQASELSNAAAQMTLEKAVPLSDFEPGEYSIQVKVTDNLTKDIIAAPGKFTVR